MKDQVSRNMFAVRNVAWRGTLILFFGMGAGLSVIASAAEIRIAGSQSSFDCTSARPGDTVTLAAGNRGPLVIRNCSGTGSNPIVFRNDPGGNEPAIIRSPAGANGGFVLACDNCVGVILDGSGKWNGAPSGRSYGIRLTSAGGSPSAFLKLTGVSRSITVRGLEIDGVWPSISDNGIGISLNDHDLKMASSPGLYYENVLIEKNYIHNVQGEGMYIGPNWYTGGLPLRNIEIRENIIEDTGWDGIQLKSAVAGTNLIHDNVLKRVGSQTTGKIKGEIYGISLLDGNGKIYGNYIEQTGDTAIQHWIPDLPASYGLQQIEIFNNVVVNAGVTGTTGRNAISSGSADINRAGQKTALTSPRIHHNTIIRPNGWGIAIGSASADGAYVQNNIIADAESGPIKAAKGVDTSNNRIGTVADMAFVDVGRQNYRLRSSSPARNAGIGDFPAVDFDGVPRPIDNRADQGAFEYHEGAAVPTKPMAPDDLAVE